jgi:deoxyinosine 3'endonuclease (endonuclease V)
VLDPSGPEASGGARAAAGLGARAHAEFGVPVIGVAKSPFRTATHAIPVLRGDSARPLYVTAAGMPRADAASLVRNMDGPHRMPSALRRADTLARDGVDGGPVRKDGSAEDAACPGGQGRASRRLGNAHANVKNDDGA